MIEHPVERPGPGTPVTVLGLARSGIAAARFLLKLGCAVRISELSRTPAVRQVSKDLEEAGALVENGRHTREFIEGSVLVVLSPGIPLSAPPVRWAAERGIPVVSELELGSWYCAGQTVAVTGSNGKSTVVSMLGKILETAGRKAVVCGNIGTPLCSVLNRIGPETVAVLEVSSFQLEPSLSFHARIGCVLNVTDNHLDRHGSFADYRAAKARLFAHQSHGGWAVLNADDAVSLRMSREVRAQQAFFSRRKEVTGAFLRGGELWLNLPGLSGKICGVEELSLQAPHDQENGLAAACMAGLLGVAPEISGRALSSFRGLPHRQEWIAQRDGVTFINDSKSTTVASGLRAIEAAPGPVVLIAGGRDKGGDFRPLSFEAVARKLKAAVLIGEDGPKIAHSLKGTVPFKKARDLGEAVRTAFGLARPGECVLLSPMCTSFDMFRNFEDRGEKFTRLVQAMES
ncbi:MAG: UDP-N-acetylmuramoyl-L-alanine--D-glutamate ligase [Candidatus Omnitrophota bacterium]|nr:UDP-N-acetylmuramoyl-L-alanine--D-glutamate ligase [Candidatus Omnitrophota bacterium]